MICSIIAGAAFLTVERTFLNQPRTRLEAVINVTEVVAVSHSTKEGIISISLSGNHVMYIYSQLDDFMNEAAACAMRGD